eukprot:Nitzschia sp. Nitz4//scaffold114_size70088//24192//26279//NITZ4_005976-RA/size70088-processed-gene-0.34-mRNA-1//-1//CDS//3329533420//4038//frame0
MSTSSGTSTPSELPRLTMSQVVALYTTLNFLVRSCVGPPLLALGLPLVWRLLQFLLDPWTRNQSLFFLMSAASLTFALQKWLEQVAPSRAQAQQAWQSKRLEFGLGSAVVSWLVLRFLWLPLVQLLGMDSMQFLPSFSVLSILRVAFGLLLLGLSVVLRYVGPPSVMRCSSTPLASYPMHQKFHHFLAHTSSWQAFLTYLTAPSAKGQSPSPDATHPARRQQQPFWTSVASQLLISVTLAYILANYAVLPLLGEVPTNQARIVVLSTIVATLTHLCQTALQGRAHELDPSLQRSSTFSNLSYPPNFQQQWLLPSAVVLLSVWIGQGYSVGPTASDLSSLGFSTYFASLMSGNLVFLYLSLFDMLIRANLCSMGVHLPTTVAHLAQDDSMETYLDVVMYSLLYQDRHMVKALSDTPNKQNYHHLDRNEVMRHTKAFKDMVSTLLHKTRVDEAGAHLEEDILRLTILASFGQGQDVLAMPSAQKKNIMYWLEPKRRFASKLPGSEPLVVPLVRSLCVYIGSLGEALRDCAKQQSPWLLPPGGIVCSTYAVRGAVRFLLHNLDQSSQTLGDWRRAQLSLLIPVFLTCLYRLETGLMQFIQATSEGSKEALAVSSGSLHLEKLNFFRTQSPALLPTYEAIHMAVLLLLEKLNSLENIRRIHFAVDLDCEEWIQSIIQQMSATKRETSSRLVPYLQDELR